ncbi:MAG: hypothetical protein ACK56F_29325, partial [bacterium]
MAHPVRCHLHCPPPSVDQRDLVPHGRPCLLAVPHTHQIERRPRDWLQSHVLCCPVGHQCHLRPCVPERYARPSRRCSYPLRHELNRWLRLQSHCGRDQLRLVLPRRGGGL